MLGLQIAAPVYGILELVFVLFQQFDRLGVNLWVDFWGYDVNHDWDWWYKQVPYFMPYLLGE